MEQTNLLNEFNQPQQQFASTGQRLANYIIDLIVIYAVIFIVAMLFGGLTQLILENTGIYYLLFFGSFFAYYAVLEGMKGKTVGKMVTKTTVITDSGEPMSIGKAVVRTLCRFVPFEFISAFFGGPMWHDKWAGTKLVKD